MSTTSFEMPIRPGEYTTMRHLLPTPEPVDTFRDMDHADRSYYSHAARQAVFKADRLEREASELRREAAQLDASAREAQARIDDLRGVDR